MSDEADGRRDVVFVSYSHQDAAWVQRVRVLLQPLVRREQLRLWADTDIRAGDEWHPDIMRAIEQSSIALLLVSADFLNSDFIMEQELPALLRQGVRLAPVLVGPCLWKQVPELTKVQWLHDPGRDGALNLVADLGQRDQRLVEICERLVELAPRTQGAVVSGSSPVPDPVPVSTVQAGAEHGALSEVPGLPPGYVARDELAAVIEAVITADGGAVGLTGEVSAVGLHGQGGIGKSVLAAAVAHEENIRRRFPDGVYWVTLGEKADVLAGQLDLLARLGVRDRTARTAVQARSQLSEVLQHRRVLLVIDDVWSEAAALAFRVTGRYGRVLYTSRDPQVLVAVGARLHPVDVLSPAVARAVAAAVLAVAPEALPAAADQSFASVGRVALAVALLAAAVRGGRSWDDVVGVLRHDAGIFGDHPYANTFKAMQIAVRGLSPQLTEALLSLAVFPPDSQIPVAAITRYWAHTRQCTAQRTARDLDLLAAARVLHIDQDTVGFHDLQHEYLLLHAPMVALLHAELLDAYRVLLPADGDNEWSQLPVGEPYIWDHLIAHLRGAGDRQVLVATVTNPAYLVRRIAMGGPHAAEADVSQAAALIPAHSLIEWWQGWIARHAHLLTPVHDDNGHGASLAPTMLAWLTADRSLPPGVDPEQLRSVLPHPYLRVRWGLSPPTTALVRVLRGHTGGVNAVVWSPDGTRLASAGGDGVRVWDVRTGEQVHTLSGHTGGVCAVVWSPVSIRLASAGGGGVVRVWDAHTGEQLRTPSGHTGGVRAVAWSPDAIRLASAGDDGVRVWDVRTGEQLHTLSHFARTVAWSPEGTRLASASYDEVRVWDAHTGEQVHTLSGHTGGEYALPWSGVDAVVWSPEGTRLASASYDEVRVWDAHTGKQVHTLSHFGRAVAWSPEGTRLASAGYDEVRVWDPRTGEQLSTLSGHTRGVDAVAWSPEGTRLASAGKDGEVRVWNPHTGEQLSTLRDYTRGARAVVWSPERTRLASAGDGGEVRVWDARTGEQLHMLSGRTGRVDAVAWSPEGSRLASAGKDGEVRVWNPHTGEQLHTLSGHPGVVRAGGWPDRYRWWRRRMRSGYNDGLERAMVRAVVWSPDGTRLASAGKDEKVLVWNLRTGKQLRTLSGHTEGVQAMAWSPDGTRLASGHYDGKVRVWDPHTGKQLRTLSRHPGGVWEVAWSPESIRLASAHRDGKVRVWDGRTGEQLRTLSGHTGRVDAVAWSPDGTRLVSVGEDGRICISDPDHPDGLIYLQVQPFVCLQWGTAGIAVGGLHGLSVFDLI